MKSNIILLCMVITAGITGCQTTNYTSPNIILVFGDDISAREIPIYGSSEWSYAPKGGDSRDSSYRASTPVLDQIATEGCWIETAWAATVCSPSRAMMMTGRYAHLHKWWHNGDIGTFKNEHGKTKSWPFYESSPHSLGQVAKMGGYSSLWVGKTQMKQADLTKYGFDEGVFTPGQFGQTNPYTDFKVQSVKRDGQQLLLNMDTGEEVDYYQQFGWYWKPHVQLMNHPTNSEQFEWWPNTDEARKEFGLNTYGPDIEMNFALDFIARKHVENQPFFIYHTSHLGHDGWDFLQTGEGSKWPGTPVIEWKNGEYTRTEPDITGDSGVYNTHGTVTESGIHTHIDYLDYQVWQYLEKLKELSIDKNTLFIFCADNGTWGYGKGSHASQRGTHVPLIIYAPGMKLTKKGRQNVLASMADMLPTIAEIAGVSLPEDYEINGESLIPFLTTDKPKHREWNYAYKQEKQLIRGIYVLKDGNDLWYDVSGDPKNLIDFPLIKDWSMVSEDHRKERDKLEKILPHFDMHDKEHDAPDL